jgi:hypothetical protein
MKTTMRASPPSASEVERLLDDAFMDTLCVLAGVPKGRAKAFKSGVRSHVRIYLEMARTKTAYEIDDELTQLAKLAEKALSLAARNASKLEVYLDDIGERLCRLSAAAVDYLRATGKRVIVHSDSAPPDPTMSFDLIDPRCYSEPIEQIAALQSLYGALAGPHAAKRRPGRPRKPAERYLYLMLAFSYEYAIGRAANDKSPRFMKTCDALRQQCRLSEFRPDSIARTLRYGREED